MRFKDFLLIEQDPMAGGMGGPPPMGGGMDPMAGGMGGPPPMGGGMDPMAGGMGGPPMGAPPPGGQEPPIPKSYNVWDVLEAILTGKELPQEEEPVAPPEQQPDMMPPGMGQIPGMGAPMGGGMDQMGGAPPMGGMGGPVGGGGPHLMG